MTKRRKHRIARIMFYYKYKELRAEAEAALAEKGGAK